MRRRVNNNSSTQQTREYLVRISLRFHDLIELWIKNKFEFETSAYPISSINYNSKYWLSFIRLYHK